MALESFHEMVSKTARTVATAAATIAFARYDQRVCFDAFHRAFPLVGTTC